MLQKPQHHLLLLNVVNIACIIEFWCNDLKEFSSDAFIPKIIHQKWHSTIWLQDWGRSLQALVHRTCLLSLTISYGYLRNNNRNSYASARIKSSIAAQIAIKPCTYYTQLQIKSHKKYKLCILPLPTKKYQMTYKYA